MHIIRMENMSPPFVGHFIPYMHFGEKGLPEQSEQKLNMYEVKIEIEISAKNSFTNLEFRNSKLKKLKV